MPQHEELAAVIHRELAPITIGMTGDSRLEGRDVAISTPLRAAFDCLDKRYPSTPKILQTRRCVINGFNREARD
jgi:hypothetical protein